MEERQKTARMFQWHPAFYACTQIEFSKETGGQGENMERLLQEYGKHSDDNLYRSAMNLIVRANRERFEEGKEVCEALMELFKDDIEAAQQKGRIEGRMEGILAMIEDYLEEGFSVGKIMKKLEKRFGLTPQEAQEYLEKYGN